MDDSSQSSEQNKHHKRREGWKNLFGFGNKKTEKNQTSSDDEKTHTKEEQEPGLSKDLAESALSPAKVDNEHNKTSLGTCWDDFKEFCFSPMSVFVDEDEPIQGCFAFPMNIANFVQKDLEGKSLYEGEGIRSECVQERDIQVQEEQVVHHDVHNNEESTMYEDAHVAEEHLAVERVHPKGREKEKDTIEELEQECGSDEQEQVHTSKEQGLLSQIAEQSEPQANEKDQGEQNEGTNESRDPPLHINDIRESDVDEIEYFTLSGKIVGGKERWSTLGVDAPKTCIYYPKKKQRRYSINRRIAVQ